MVNVFAYQYAVDLLLKEKEFPYSDFIKEIVTNSGIFQFQKLQEYWRSNLIGTLLQDQSEIEDFTFLAKHALLFYLFQGESEEFEHTRDIIKYRMEAIRNVTSGQMFIRHWDQYFQLLEVAINRVFKRISIEGFEEYIAQLDWAVLDQKLIPDASTLIGFVYLKEPENDQVQKSRIWLNKAVRESAPESNLVNLLLINQLLRQDPGNAFSLVAVDLLKEIMLRIESPAIYSVFKSAMLELEFGQDNDSFQKLTCEERINYVLTNDQNKIDLSNLSLTEFPQKVFEIEGLESINLQNNRLANLPLNIDQFSSLRRLNLANNKLSYLPNTLRNISRNLDEFVIEGNEFNIPKEISSQSPTNIIDYILRLQREKSAPLREVKLIFIGNGGVGKTSLINQLVSKSFNPDENKTDGIQITPWELANKRDKIKVNIWDFGGQEIMHATHKFFMTSRSVYVLVIDSRSEDQYGDNQIEYWLKLIKSFAGMQVPVIIVINKSDLHFTDIGEGTIRDNFPNVIGFAQTSCSQNRGIQKLNKLVLKGIRSISYLDELFPHSYHEVKSILEKENRDYIQYVDYERICNRVDPAFSPDEKESLITLLHDLGIMLNFSNDRRLQDTQVLNPEWVTKGVYQIITSPKTAGKKGVLFFKTIFRILDDKLYPSSKEKYYIIDMMHHFELAYANEKSDQYFIPGAFPKDRPSLDVLKKHINKASIQFFYVYDVLPSSIIARFITKFHLLIHSKKIWRNGIIIHWERCYALIESDPIQRQIKIMIVGDGNRRALLAIIRNEFMVIHSSHSGIEVEQKIPISDEVLVDYNDLLIYEEEGIINYFEPKLKRSFAVKTLLDGVKITPKDSPYLISLVEKDKLAEVLNLLKDLYDNNNEVIIQIARLSRLEKEIRQGIIDNVDTQRNRLIRSILELINNI